MTKKDKRLQKAKRNPKAVTFEELMLILEETGYRIRRGSGSHHFADITVEGREWTLTIAQPHGDNKFVNIKVVKRALNQIAEVEILRTELESENTEDNDEQDN